MHRTLLVAALSLGATACSPGTDPTVAPGDELVLQVARSFRPGGLPADPARITNARIEGHRLLMTVTHAGGCRVHAFGVVTGPDFGDSNPPFALFRLAHESDGDRCEAFITRNLSIDLRPIEAAMRRLGASAVRIALAEPGDMIAGVGELIYRF